MGDVVSMSTCREEGNEDVELDIPEWDPTEISFPGHMLAGSVAGLVEHIAFFPLDTIKTLSQCNKCGIKLPHDLRLQTKETTTWALNKKLVQEEGFLRLWRGGSTMFYGCVPGKNSFSIFIDVSCL